MDLACQEFPGPQVPGGGVGVKTPSTPGSRAQGPLSVEFSSPSENNRRILPSPANATSVSADLHRARASGVLPADAPPSSNGAPPSCVVVQSVSVTRSGLSVRHKIVNLA